MTTAKRRSTAREDAGELSMAGVEAICELLRERIRRGHYDSLGRLPDEYTLIHELEVSRTRLRAALEMLRQEGAVVRLRGRGTFVPNRLSFQTNRSGGITRFAREAHQAVAAHRLTSHTTWAMDAIGASDFGVAAGTPAHLLERCSYIDGQVFSSASYVVRADLAPLLLEPGLRDLNLDMRAWLAEASLAPLGWVDSTVEACSAEPHAAQLLGCPPAAPLLRMNRHFYVDDGRLLAHGSHVHRGDRYTFQAVREHLTLPPDLGEIHHT